MPENEIRPGESIAQWKARISSQAKAKQEDEINKLNEDRAVEAEMNRRRLANASGEEFFEDIAPLTFEDFRTEKPANVEIKSRSPFWTKFKTAIRNPFKVVSNKLGQWRNRKNHERNDVDIENVPEEFTPGFNEFPYFANLSRNAYGSISSVPDDANSILFNHFVDQFNPHVHSAGRWRRMSGNTPLKDYNQIPLRDINLFYGVEDGTFKVMPLSEFNDTTTVAPSYFTDAKQIQSIEGLPEKQYQKAYDNYLSEKNRIDSLLANISAQKQAREDELFKEVDEQYQTNDFGQFEKDSTYRDRVTARVLPFFRDSTRLDISSLYPDSYRIGVVDTAGRWVGYPYERFGLKDLGKKYSNYLDAQWNTRMSDPTVQRLSQQHLETDEQQPKKPGRFRINYTDGTSDTKFAGADLGGNDKWVLGNTNGGFFIQDPRKLFEMYPQYIDTLNKHMPMFPIIVDQGSYWRSYRDLDKVGITPKEAHEEYDIYKDLDVPKFFIGTRSEKKGGNLPKLQKGKYFPLQYPDWQDGDNCPTNECSLFSNSMSRDYFGTNTYGNAWDLNGEPLYTNPIPKPINSSKDAYFKYLHDSADQFASTFDFSQLNPDEVYQVNMYYNGSPSWYKAEPTGNGTHAGYLEFKNGKWNVVHNIHKKVHVDALKDILGGNQKSYGVLNIYRAPGFNRKDAYKQQLDSYVLENPMGIWTEDSANVRNWLRKNSPETLQNYWNNLTDEQRKKVDRRFRP